MNKRRISLLLAVLATLFVLALLVGCQKKECQASTDCPVINSCFKAKCVDGKCTQAAQADCCGNKKCEPSFGENACTCNDCGNCTLKGKVKYNVTQGTKTKTLDSKYAEFVCNAQNQCIVGADPASVREKTPILSFNEGTYFKADLLMNVNNPFNVDKDKMSLKIELRDIGDETSGAITFTKIKILSGSSLLAEKDINFPLANISDTFSQDLEIKSAQTLVEEDLTIDVDISYEFNVLRAGKLDTIRNSRKLRLPDKITVIVPENVND